MGIKTNQRMRRSWRYIEKVLNEERGADEQREEEEEPAEKQEDEEE